MRRVLACGRAGWLTVLAWHLGGLHEVVGDLGDRVFHLGDCHSRLTVAEVFLAKLALEEGVLKDFVPNIGLLLPDSNFSVTISHVPSCSFTDTEGDKLLHVLRGTGTSTDNGPAVAMAGCACSSGTRFLALLAATSFTPVISGAASSSELTDSSYPSFMRTIPNDFAQSYCQARLIRHFGWKRVAWLVFRNEDYGNFFREEVMRLLHPDPHTVHFLDKQPLSRASDFPAVDLGVVLDDIREHFPPNQVWYRVLAIMTTTRRLLHVYVREMLKYGAINENTVLLFGENMCSQKGLNLITDELEVWQEAGSYFYDPYWENPAAHMIGAVCTAPDVGSAWMEQQSRFAQWISSVSSTDLERVGAPTGTETPSMESIQSLLYRPTAFDSMLTIFFGISNLLHQGMDASQVKGQALFEEMRKKSFSGMSGPVSFDGSGDRHSRYLVMNLQLLDTEATLVPVYSFAEALSSEASDSSLEIFEVASFIPVAGTSVMFANNKSSIADFLYCTAGHQPIARVDAVDLRHEYCSECALGRSQERNDTAESCLACPARQFAGMTGSTNCENCGSGSSNSESGAAECPMCPAGQAQALVAQSECVACPPGTFSPENGMSECTPCQRGAYQDSRGHTACISCVNGTGTLDLFSKDPLDCDCLPGDYMDDTGICAPAPAGRVCGFGSKLQNCSCEPGKRAQTHDISCVMCEEHLYCPGGHTLAERIVWPVWDDTVLVEQEYMTLRDSPYSVYKCVSSSVCESRRSPFASDGPDRICRDGVQLLARCGRCMENYWGVAADSCRLCDGRDKALFYLKAFGTFLLNVAGVIYMYKRFNRPMPAGMITVSCILSMLQSLLALRELPVDWPKELRFILDAVHHVVSIEGVNQRLQFRFECLGDSGYQRQLLQEVLSPLIVFVDFMIIYIVLRIVRPLQKLVTWHWPCVHNIIGLVFTRLFISIMRYSLALLYRLQMPNGKVMISSVPELEFLSDDWCRVMPFGAMGALVYGGSTLAYVAYLVIVAPWQVTVDTEFLSKARFCFGSFRPDRHWWILVYLALVFLIVFVVIEFHAKPFKFLENTVIDLMFNTLLIILLIVATSFIDESTLSSSEVEYWNSIYASVIVASLMACMAFALFKFGSWFWTIFQHKGKLEGERARLGWQFRDCAVATLLVSDTELMSRLATFGDSDLLTLRAATDTMITTLLGAQTSKRRLNQRLIPGVPYREWSYMDMQIGVWEKIQSGEFATKVAGTYRVRAWLVNMALHLVERGKDSGMYDMQTSTTRSTRSNMSRASSVATARVKAVSTKLKGAIIMDLSDHIKALVIALDLRDDVPMDRQTFHTRVHRTFECLEIPYEDVDLIFNIADLGGDGMLVKANFVLMMNALLPEWMLDTMLGEMIHASSSHIEIPDEEQGHRASVGMEGKEMKKQSTMRVRGVLNHMHDQFSRDELLRQGMNLEHDDALEKRISPGGTPYQSPRSDGPQLHRSGAGDKLSVASSSPRSAHSQLASVAEGTLGAGDQPAVPNTSPRSSARSAALPAVPEAPETGMAGESCRRWGSWRSIGTDAGPLDAKTNGGGGSTSCLTVCPAKVASQSALSQSPSHHGGGAKAAEKETEALVRPRVAL